MQRACVAITGANGSIGPKLARYLLGVRARLPPATSGPASVEQQQQQQQQQQQPPQPLHLKLLDDYDGFHAGRAPQDPRAVNLGFGGTTPAAQMEEVDEELCGTFEHVSADFAEPGGAGLASTLRGVDSVVHLAAVNPYPECTWAESRASMDMTANVLAACQAAGVRRVVFASSNHVVGAYQRQGALLDPPRAPLITPTTLPHPDCFQAGPAEALNDFTAYAAAKIAGEAACAAAAAATPGLSCIAVRVGWCQPGRNHPSTMTAGGSPTTVVDGAAGGVTGYPPEVLGYDRNDELLRWFHMMWLSNRDMGQLVTRCLEYDFADPATNTTAAAASASPIASSNHDFLVVNGVSRNTGRRWSTDNYGRLGYEPQDDATEHVPGYR